MTDLEGPPPPEIAATILSEEDIAVLPESAAPPDAKESKEHAARKDPVATAHPGLAAPLEPAAASTSAALDHVEIPETPTPSGTAAPTEEPANVSNGLNQIEGSGDPRPSGLAEKVQIDTEERLAQEDAAALPAESEELDDLPVPDQDEQHVENGEGEPHPPSSETADESQAQEESAEPTVLPTDYFPPLEQEDNPMLIERPLKDPVVPRYKWGAKPSRRPLPKREGLISRVFLSHTESKSCESEAECVDVVQAIQEDFIKNKGDIDLPYNFLLGGDGRVYEGRGWQGLAPFPKLIPERYDDRRYLDVAFVGTFNSENMLKPTEYMVQARRELFKYGHEQGYFEGSEIITSIVGRI